MSTRPTIWPHLVIEDGAPCAGLQPGDAIAFAPRHNVYFGGYHWAGRVALHIWSTDAHYTDAGCHRVNDDPLGVEHTDDVGRTWQRLDRAHWVVAFGERHYRFVVDGPPLAVSKRFELPSGPVLAAHCTEVGRPASGEDGAIYSEWLLPAHGATQQLLVIERPSGELVYRVQPRAIGIYVGAVQARAQTGVLDAEIAAGIAAQIDDDQSDRAWLGWDGVVRVLDETRTAPDAPVLGVGRRALVYGRLTRRGDFSKIDFARAKAELLDTRPASIAEISAFVTALDATAAAREAALVEECGVLAG